MSWPARWVAFSDRHHAALLALSLAIAVAGGAGTIALYSDLRTDVTELLPRRARSVRDLEAVSARAGGFGEDSVLVTGADAATLKRFGDDLARKLREKPRSIVRWVEYRVDALGAFYQDRRWLLPDLAAIRALRDRVELRVKWEKERANPLYVGLEDGEGEEAPPGFDDLKPRLLAGNAPNERLTDGYYLGQVPGEQEGSTMLMLALLVRMGGAPDDFKQVELVDRTVRAAVAELDPKRYSPTLRVGYGGYVGSMVLEHEALSEDLVVATLLVFLSVVAVICVYYRCWKAVPAIGLPLLVATLATFGIADLVIGHLNSNTAFLGSIVLGNGINVGLILFARYLEERRTGRAPRAAMEIALSGTWRATLTAAGAAGISYGSLLATEFRGFNQFGFIGCVGLLLCWFFAYALTPALVLAWEARAPWTADAARRPRPFFSEQVAAIVHRWPRQVLALATLATALALVAGVRFARDPLEMDFNKLSDARTAAPGGPRWWDTRVTALLGEHPTPNVVACKDAAEARLVAAAFEAARDGNPGSVLGSVLSIARLVPTDQLEKIALLNDIREQLSPARLAQLPKGTAEKVAQLLPPAGLQPFTPADLPEWLRERLTETDGTFGSMVLVFPSRRIDVWNGPDVLRFEKELRSVRLPRADLPIASPLLLFTDMLRAIQRDGPRATWLSLLGVALLVVLALGVGRRERILECVNVLGALGIGVVWFVGLAGLLGLRVNILNFIALPITFGIGVDYATNIFERRESDHTRSIAECLRTTGGAVALCSLTTIIGYSSLLVAKNQALVSFGLLADLGEVACLAAALFALPAVLRLRELRAVRLGLAGCGPAAQAASQATSAAACGLDGAGERSPTARPE